MLQWDFVLSLGYFPLHHKEYKQNIYIFSYTFQYHSAPFLNLGFTGFVSSVTIEWLFYISWFTSVFIYLFTVLECITISVLGLPVYILCSYMSLSIIAWSSHYNFNSFFFCTIFLPLSLVLSFLQALVINPILLHICFDFSIVYIYIYRHVSILSIQTINNL